MARVLTFSRTFPAYHPKAGQPTFFVEKILSGLIKFNYDGCGTELLKSPIVDIGKLTVDNFKWHTIRAGNRWKVGDKFSPRVWSGKPYNSKQIQFAPDMEVKKVFDLKYQHISRPFVTHKNEKGYDSSYPNGTFDKMALNDGFVNREDLQSWLLGGKGWSPVFEGQIICWNETIEY